MKLMTTQIFLGNLIWMKLCFLMKRKQANRKRHLHNQIQTLAVTTPYLFPKRQSIKMWTNKTTLATSNSILLLGCRQRSTSASSIRSKETCLCTRRRARRVKALMLARPSHGFRLSLSSSSNNNLHHHHPLRTRVLRWERIIRDLHLQRGLLSLLERNNYLFLFNKSEST